MTVDASVHELVRERAGRQPDTPALDGLSYGELDAWTDRMALSLREHGVGRGAAVAVRLRPGVHHIVALLGILKTGGYFVPLGPADPFDRCVEVVREIRPVCLVPARPPAGEELASWYRSELGGPVVPVQPELPVWITSTGAVETFRGAGRVGAGLLTHLLGQDMDRLAEKIGEYRKAAAEAGPPGWRGHVVVMVHTFLDDDDEACREAVRAPLTAYMRSSLGLILGSRDLGTGDADPGSLRPDEIDFLVNRSFDRYFDHDGLLGSVHKARDAVARFRELGVDEVACLIDFGLPADLVLAGLKHLDRARES